MTRIYFPLIMMCCCLIIEVQTVGNSLWPPGNTENKVKIDPSVTLQGNKTCMSFCKHFSAVCKNNGVCKQATDSKCHWYCECVPGFTGLLCDQAINNGTTTMAVTTTRSIKDLQTTSSPTPFPKRTKKPKVRVPNPRLRPGKRNILSTEMTIDGLQNHQQTRNSQFVPKTLQKMNSNNKKTVAKRQKEQTKIASPLTDQLTRKHKNQAEALAIIKKDRPNYEQLLSNKNSINFFDTLMGLKILRFLQYISSGGKTNLPEATSTSQMENSTHTLSGTTTTVPVTRYPVVSTNIPTVPLTFSRVQTTLKQNIILNSILPQTTHHPVNHINIIKNKDGHVTQKTNIGSTNKPVASARPHTGVL